MTKIFNEKFDFDNIKNIGITGLTTQLISFCISNIYEKNKKNVILVTNSLYEANQIYSSLSKLNENVFLFPMDDFLTSEALAMSPELKSIRLNTLNNLSTSTNNIVITNLMGALRYLPSKEIWKSSNIKIKKSDTIDKNSLYEKLINIGYDSNVLATKTGDISNRGFIIDVFPVGYDNPVRIEFWGDDIDSIRFFDVESQRSLDEIDEINISPYSEFINVSNKDIPRKQKFLPYVLDEVKSILDYLDNPIKIYKDYTQIKNAYKNLQNQIFEYSMSNKEEYKTDYMNNFDILTLKDAVYLMNIDNMMTDIKLNKIYNYSSKKIDNFKSDFNLLNEYISSKKFQNKKIILSFKNLKTLENIKKYINFSTVKTTIDTIYEDKINLIESNIEEGFELDDYVIITENELFKSRNNSINYKNKFKVGTKIKKIDNLKIGDYVVHTNHGIGVYNGIKTLNKKGNEKDYLEVLYRDNDKLYIPVEKIELISKYSSNEGITPKINKLGGTEWQKTKLRIKNKIKDIAEKLIKVSAERAMRPGFACNPDDKDQMNFESEFKFTPTKDQIIAIDKIKKSMEEARPMDMLLCGDVGYGKTEVAFRAIFKSIDNGKQVAYLCPTTILSSQQYKNALERFKNYGINIALLNRFTSKKESNEILKKLQEGKIDLLFGTHRILSNDIKFKNLGLLVIDEEQRFGVAHKEKIKEYKSNIDILTLSATPIPRTLQMSLVGIRELALIETPPAFRYPVQTYVVEESKQLIREAIYSEMSRKGQIFILFNSVEHIEEKLHEIQNLVPEAKIKIAHGQMTKNQIEDTMFSFINNEFDILLCTTIIETGIDIPNVNTLIIFDADRFGLSQLYQIRGRVGRSNKIAYAYLLYGKNKILNETAVKRLDAIKEFTELGSGFSIAMRDLSIRGAGDILGTEQAGFIDTIGYDLYVKMLNDEIDHIKGIKTKEEVCEDEKPMVEVSTHIKDNYIDNDTLKIEIHKKINEIKSLDDLYKIRSEIEDRFGKIDEDLNIYMYSEWLEKLCKNIGINKIDQTNLFVEFSIDKEIVEKLDIEELFVNASKISMNYKFNYKNDRLYIKLTLLNLEKHYIYYLCELLEKIEKMLV